MLTVRIPDDLRDGIDDVRGAVARERWVRDELARAVAAHRSAGAVEAAPVVEGIASESQPGASWANDSNSQADAPATPAPPRAPRARAVQAGAHHPTCKCPVCKPAGTKR